MRITLLLLALFSATTIHAEPVEQVRDNCIIQLVNNDVDAIDAYLACSDFAVIRQGAHYNRENRLIAGVKWGSKGTNPELARRRELHAIEARFKAEEEI